MRAESGMSLTELITTMAVGSILAATSVTVSMPWLARETMRSAMADTRAAIQIAKIEAASRNRDCRFVVNTETGALRVWDTLNTVSTLDDELLHEQRIPESVGFARPDGGSVVTLPQVGTSPSYQTIFTAQGMAQGTGAVFLVGGDRYGRVSIHGAGGVEVGVWTNGVWHTGS